MSELSPSQRQFESVIETLGLVRLRPGMYIGTIEFNALESFLGGFAIGALAAIGGLIYGHLRRFQELELKDRGYNLHIVSSAQLEDEIRVRYPEDLQAFEERIDIEIGSWKRLLAFTKSSEYSRP